MFIPPPSPPPIFCGAPDSGVPTIPTVVVAQQRSGDPNPDLLYLDIRVDHTTGRKYLQFDYQSISDIHWGSKFCRAKRLCMALRDFRTIKRDIVGDGFGGEETRKKDTWHIGLWHRQGMAMVIEQAQTTTDTTYEKGNHEVDADRYWNKSRTFFGIKFQRESTYVDAKGQIFEIAHGDKFDVKLIKDLYSFGEKLLKWGGEVDYFLQENKFAQKLIHQLFKVEKASVSAWVKRQFKTIINKNMGILKTIETYVDARPIAGLIFGHSHMMGAHRTPGGKYLINDGCCTDHVQFQLVDKYGKQALVEHHRDRMNIEMVATGKKYTVMYKDIGLEQFSDEPQLVESQYTKKADRFLRLAFRIWPSRDRQKLQKNIKQKKMVYERLLTTLKTYEGATEPDKLFTALGRTDAEIEGLEKLYRQCPIPRHRQDEALQKLAA